MMALKKRARRGAFAALAAMTVFASAVITAAPAQADTEEIAVSYGITGSTVVKKTNSTVPLGPGSLDGALLVNTDTGAIALKGNLKLPPSTADISLFNGVVRLQAKVTIIPLGPVTGTLANSTLTTNTKADMQISHIKLGFGTAPVIPVPTFPAPCRTVKPLDLNLVSKNVDIFAPSFPAVGTYTIPDFKDCVFSNIAVGALISGPGNTIKLDLASKN